MVGLVWRKEIPSILRLIKTIGKRSIIIIRSIILIIKSWLHTEDDTDEEGEEEI